MHAISNLNDMNALTRRHEEEMALASTKIELT